ncbi:MAG: tol-pal system protein YbgF [Gemmatimonadota bacterium]
MRTCGRLAAAALTWAVLSAPAHATLFGDDEARQAILDLRARVAEQDKRLQEKDTELAKRLDQLENANRAQLEFANTIDSLKREIAALRGQVEKLANDLAVQQQRNRDLYGDVDARLKKLEPISATIDGRTATVDRNEQSAYDAALAQFRAGDFRGAATSLQSFLARYPQSAYAPSAQYWLGNSLYSLKDYKSAIAAQQVILDRYRDSPRAPDALLNIASSQLELNQKTQSQATLQRILKEYPDSEAAKAARERLPATKR